ncbi:NAD-dependent epimerase/dehydratase family protein [Marinobacter koreensis]|uniref:NAD-dependent epimerase/dehydratase family protein n=1 Tax=Marinobacter koreensis TaxID=335974 RepID=A0ABW0RTK7_9GAMM|nr:NAD-dependent epimerase/dehydratase family protein [Marinobacter koreensis]MCK7549068.1 NAD-dependent epimerase/dehydratase family protein [Marinobacter koreensis]
MAITESDQRPRVLLAGCGKLGGEIAQRLARRADVFGLRRHGNQVPEGVTGISADLTDPATLRGVLPSEPDIVIYCLTPSSYDEAGYRAAYVTGLSNLLKALGTTRLKRLFFISSTSVYGQDDDSWVDETSPAEPGRRSGQCIREGEETALNSGHPATVVRFSGIYGPSRRRFLDEVLKGGINPGSPAPFTNRIHEADAARAIEHLVERTLSDEPLARLYVASDSEPARLDTVVNWIREQVPCQNPKPDARTGGRAGSKRCSNRSLLQTGFEFRYPDFRAGYREMIEMLN